jgi:hypothetical protein
LREAHAEKVALEEYLQTLYAEQDVTLHPQLEADYRREDVISRIRALVGSIVLTPKQDGPGVDIEITGCLARIIELATGRKVELPVLITLERVKGIEPSS